MSRINTQDDRLVRGPDSFQTRTAVDSVRIAPERKDTITQLISSVSQAAGAVAGVVDQQRNNEKSVRDEADRVSYNTLLELGRKAEEDPTLIPEYTKQRNELLNNLPKDSSIFSKVVNLPTKKEYEKAVTDNLTAEHAGVIRKSVLDITANTFDVNTQYPSVDEARQDIFNKTLEAMTPAHKELLDTVPALREDFVRQTYGYADSTYKLGIDARSRQEVEISNNNTRIGVAITLRSGGVDNFDTLVDSLSNKTGEPTDVERTNLFASAGNQIKAELDGNILSVTDAISQSKSLRQVAIDSGDPNLLQMSSQLSSAVVDETAVDAGRKMLLEMEDSISLGRNLDFIQDLANDLALSTYTEATGLPTNPDTDSIHTLSAGTGVDQDLAVALSAQVRSVEANLSRLQVTRDQTEPYDNMSSFTSNRGDTFFSLQGQPSDPVGFSSHLNQITDSENAAEISQMNPRDQIIHTGELDARFAGMNFRHSPDRADFLVDSAQNGGRKGIVYTASAVASLNIKDDEFSYFVSDLPTDQANALRSLRDAARTMSEGGILNLTDDNVDERVTILQNAYSEGLEQANLVLNSLGTVGDSNADTALSKDMDKAVRKSLGFGKNLQFSEDANAFLLEQTSAINLSTIGAELTPSQVADILVRDNMKNNSFYINKETGLLDVSRNNLGAAPEVFGFSTETMDRALSRSPETLWSASKNGALKLIEGVGRLSPDQVATSIIAGGTPETPRNVTRKEGNALTDRVQSMVQIELGVGIPVFDSTVNDVPEAVMPLLLPKINSLLETPLTHQQVIDLFDANETDPAFLRLDIVRGQLKARGKFGGFSRVGEDAINLMEWDSGLYNLVGVKRPTRSGLEVKPEPFSEGPTEDIIRSGNALFPQTDNFN